MSNNFNKGPRQRSGRNPQGNQIPTAIPHNQISFDRDAFCALIESQGIRMVHYRAVPDPRGMASKGDNHDVLGIRQSSDNFIYKEVGTVQVLFQSNTTNTSMEDTGMLSFSTAYITLPSTYEGSNEPVIVADWDRFYLKDIEARVVDRQFVETSTTGIDRLHYPATSVEYVIDRNGVSYDYGKDFDLTEDGDLRWLTQKRPGWDAALKRGTVYAIRYRYTPFFVVARIVHEIRVAQVTDPATYDRRVERLPYQCQIVREHVYRDINRDGTGVTDDDRLQYAPPVGGMLGPK